MVKRGMAGFCDVAMGDVDSGFHPFEKVFLDCYLNGHVSCRF